MSIFCATVFFAGAGVAADYESVGRLSLTSTFTDDPVAEFDQMVVSKAGADFFADYFAENGHEKYGFTVERSDNFKTSGLYELSKLNVVSERIIKNWEFTQHAEGTWSNSRKGFYRGSFSENRTVEEGQTHRVNLTSDAIYTITENHSLILGGYGEKTVTETWADVASGAVGFGWHGFPHLKLITIASRSSYWDGYSQDSTTATVTGQFIYEVSPVGVLDGEVGRVVFTDKKKSVGENIGSLRYRGDGTDYRWSWEAARRIQSDVKKGGVYLDDGLKLSVDYTFLRRSEVGTSARWIRQSSLGGANGGDDILRGGQFMVQLRQNLGGAEGEVDALKKLVVTEAVNGDVVRYPRSYKTYNFELGVLASL